MLFSSLSPVQSYISSQVIVWARLPSRTPCISVVPLCGPVSGPLPFVRRIRRPTRFGYRQFLRRLTILQLLRLMFLLITVATPLLLASRTPRVIGRTRLALLSRTLPAQVCPTGNTFLPLGPPR